MGFHTDKILDNQPEEQQCQREHIPKNGRAREKISPTGNLFVASSKKSSSGNGKRTVHGMTTAKNYRSYVAQNITKLSSS
jgi:hypothetical protein